MKVHQLPNKDAETASAESKTAFEEAPASCPAKGGIALPIYYKSISCICPAAGEGSGNEKSLFDRDLGVRLQCPLVLCAQFIYSCARDKPAATC